MPSSPWTRCVLRSVRARSDVFVCLQRAGYQGAAPPPLISVDIAVALLLLSSIVPLTSNRPARSRLPRRTRRRRFPSVQNADGKVDVDDAEIWWQKTQAVLKDSVPGAGGFSAGFLLGARRG